MTVSHPRAAWDWRREARRGVLLLKELALAAGALVAKRALYDHAGRAARQADPVVLRRPAAGVAEVGR
jgi:hypothetical protein